MKLTLLGTGIPVADLKRRGPSQVVEIGNDLVMVDCGSGALHRLLEAGYHTPALKRIVITHLHSDHITGLSDLLWAGLIAGWWKKAPQLVGPAGTAAMVEHLMEAYSYDIKIRLAAGGEGRTMEALRPEVQEIDEGWAEETANWRLSAFRVNHEPVDEAFGFRLDSDEGSLSISGDTIPSENLIRHSQGVDLLVHEVYWKRGSDQIIQAAASEQRRKLLQYIASYHTSSEDVGKVAEKCGAKRLALTHLILRGGTSVDIEADITQHYRGGITVGEDLQSFEIKRSPG